MKLRTIDARGLACPQPVVEAKKALEEMTEGALEVLVDNEIAVQNLRKLGSYFACEPVWEKRSKGEYCVVFPLTKEPDRENTSPEATHKGAQAPLAIHQGQVVVISSDCMGSGDQVLGRLLMKGFLYSLTQLESMPETLLFYNSGAKLSKEGMESIEDLRELEKNGVKILTCGTCLDYYQLPAKPAVGGVTNLYEIAELLSSAATVIRP